ncbi:MAG: UDP-N-acetylmuramate dehydrogenase [Bdellovibrionales bacterium]|jgi:UDP-N-acetylmuramate dehydrogenase|nr:UDP-N-acetylmuramate dehydrogenase [Bdellovibrionales bacterium]
MIRENVSLAPFTSWQVGGPAEFYAEPTTEAELEQVLRYAVQQNLPITILGGGTNVLIADEGIRGLVLCLRKFSGMKVSEVNNRLEMEALAGTPKSELLKTFLKNRLEPALFLAGLPGDIGGGVVMNAGVGEAFEPREFVEITDRVEVWRWSEQKSEQKQPLIEKLSFTREELAWSYRHCEGWKPGLIAKVWLSWPLEVKPDILERVKNANRTRLTKQPLDMPSCGSVFVNPPGDKSGRLIEAAGLKGFAIGGAAVSTKHANFIVNQGGASARDIRAVIAHVQDTVLKQFGVALKTEVILMGWTR